MQNPNTASQNRPQKVKDIGSSALLSGDFKKKSNQLNKKENFAMTNKVKLFLMAAAALALTALPHVASAGLMGCPTFGC